MSIYARRKGLMDFETLPAAPVGRTARSSADDARTVPVDPDRDWTQVRRARPADYILPISKQWLRSLPHNVVPLALIVQFPRIVNLIAMQWNDRGTCPAFFEELLADRRGGRQGFPDDVRRELSRLRNYWYTRSTTLLD